MHRPNDPIPPFPKSGGISQKSGGIFLKFGNYHSFSIFVENAPRVKTALVIALLSCLPFSLPAQSPLRFTPVFRNYTTDDGLPSNETFAIKQDRQGYMWFSTTNGVCRFDGYRFEQFPDTQQTNFTAVFCWNMMEDSCGRMWWANSDGRVFYQENGRIVPWPHNHVLDSLRSKFNFVNGLIVGGCGEEIWLTSNYFGAVHVDRHGNYKVLPKAGRNANIIQVFERNDRVLGIVTSLLLFRSNPDDRYQSYYVFKNGRYSPELPFRHSNAVQMDHTAGLSGGRYLLCWGASVFLLKDLELQWSRPYDENIVWVFEDDDGSLLVGQQRGGGVRRFASLEDLRRGNIAASFLEGLSISVIFKDREGGYWFGSQERGLFYCPSLESAAVEGIPAMTADVGNGVVSDSAGKLFYGTKNGRIFELDHTRGTCRDITPGTIRHLYTLQFDETGRTLFCLGHNLSFFKKNKWLNNYRLGLDGTYGPMGASRSAHAKRGDQWWFLGATGFTRMDLNTRRELERSSYTLRQRIRMHALGTDTAGRVWLSTNAGLREYRDSQLLSPRETHPAFHQPANDIQFLPDNTMVFCPRGYGVVFWKPDSGAPPRIIGEKEGLVFNKVGRLYIEPGGAVWACTERGASRISADRRRIDNYTVKTGLPSNYVAQVAAAGGWYWLATGKGLVRLPGRPAAPPMPPPLIGALYVLNVRYPSGGAIDLPHDSSDLRIRWVALHFRSLGQINYRYRLAAGNDGPNWTPTADNQVNFSRLPAGNYRFEVQAQDVSGAWSRATTLAFTIRPPWWATWWARGGGFALLGLLVFGIYRYRSNQIRRESRLREEMRRLEGAALQAQMNPHFIFNCLNSIQNFILNNDPDAAALYLTKFAKLVRGALNASAAGQVSLEDEAGMLDNYLALERLRFKQAFDYHIEVDETLDRAGALLPPLIVQPFVENAVLHGMKDIEKDGRITVTFRRDGEHLRIDVQDNGSGMEGRDLSGGKPSLGRSITRRRLELLQWQHAQKTVSVQYFAPESGGTMVSIRLPL